MMKVSFAEIDEAYLRQKVQSGYYSSISEAIRDMVRKQRESEQGNRLQAALDRAEEAIRNGDVYPFTEELFDTAVQEGIEAAKRGEKIYDQNTWPQ